MKRILTVIAVVVLFLLVYVGFARAQDAGAVVAAPVITEQVPAAARAGVDVLRVVAYLVGFVLAALLGKLILAAEKKFKVDVPLSWELALNSLLDRGIHYAEEQGHKGLKGIGPKMSMPDSLETAANFVLDLARDKKVLELGKEKVKMLLEARLNVVRAEGLAGMTTLPPPTVERTAEAVPEPIGGAPVLPSKPLPPLPGRP